MLEHGTYTYEVQGKIIIFSLIGEFNEHGILSCLEAEKKAIEDFGEKECCLLVDCANLAGATPEAYQTVDIFYSEINYKNLSAIALVHTNYALAHLENRNIPQMKKHEVKIFTDRSSAVSWLESI